MNNCGICHLAYFPLRKEPSHRSENLSVVLFGETFDILGQEENWFHIKTHFDSYSGWITTNEMRFADADWCGQMLSEKQYYSAENFQQVTAGRNKLIIGIGSPLPGWNGDHFFIGEEKYWIVGDVLEADDRPKEFLLTTASFLLDFPYFWGGRTSFGIDCSGLSQLVYKLIGIALPRDAWQQEQVGNQVSLAEAETGDLAFFQNDEGRVTHVGLVFNKNYILHASGKVRIDSLDEKGIFNKDLGLYTHKLKSVKRVK